MVEEGPGDDERHGPAGRLAPAPELDPVELEQQVEAAIEEYRQQVRPYLEDEEEINA